MRYRIKIITFKTGRKEYFPQIKLKLGWFNLDYYGEWSATPLCGLEYRQKALNIIDKNYAGNTKRQTIEFEYIIKP